MSQLENYRNELDKYTDKIIDLIVERGEVCRRIGDYKIKHGLSIYDSNREKEVFDRIDKRVREMGLGEEDRTVLKDVFKLIMERSKEIQNGRS